MSERYYKIFSLPENLYTKKSPLLIKAGALLNDSKENKLIVQLKLQNVGKKNISKVKVELTALDSDSNSVARPIIYEYSDLNVEQGTDFGSQTPIILPDLAASSFEVCIKEVTFSNGNVWNNTGDSLENVQSKALPIKEKKLRLSILVPCLAILIAVFGYFVGYPMIAHLSGNHRVYVDMYNAKKYTIPTTVNKIEAEEFEKCDTLESITIPSNVKTINSAAFMLCGNLKSVTIEEGVTSIGEKAFMYCDSLTSITIPDSVTHIGALAFQGCDNLTSVVIGNGVTTIASNTFSYCENLTDITISGNVTRIGLGAFLNCSNLKNITIPNSVKYIGQSAFWGCSSFKNITIPEGVTEIGGYAFKDCENLESIVIPSTVTSIDSTAFSNCDKLKTIYFTGNSREWNYIDKYISSKITVYYNYIPEE